MALRPDHAAIASKDAADFGLRNRRVRRGEAGVNRRVAALVDDRRRCHLAGGARTSSRHDCRAGHPWRAPRDDGPTRAFHPRARSRARRCTRACYAARQWRLSSLGNPPPDRASAVDDDQRSGPARTGWPGDQVEDWLRPSPLRRSTDQKRRPRGGPGSLLDRGGRGRDRRVHIARVAPSRGRPV